MNKITKIIIIVVVGAIIWNIPVPAGLTHETWHVLAIFVAAVLGFVLQPLPIGAVAFITLGFISVTGLMDMKDALAGFHSTTVWLIVSAFIYSLSFIKTGLGRRIAYVLIRYMGTNSLRLGYVLGLSDIIIAPATPSNTARAGGIIYPIVRSVAEGFDSEPDKNPRRIGAFLMLSAFYSNTTASSMFMTASAPNALMVSLVATATGVKLGWGAWALAAFVPGLVAYFVMPLFVYIFYPPEIKHTPEARTMAEAELAKMGPLSKPEKITIVVFILSLVAWGTSSFTGINATAIAIAAVGIMLLLNILTWDDALKEKSAWDTLVWLGTMLSIADRMNALGLFTWFAEIMGGFFVGIPWPITLVLLCFIYAYTHYFFTGMTTHIVAMFAGLLSVAVAAGSPPMLAALCFVFLTNLMAVVTHYANGPSVLYYAAGYIPQRTWWTLGAVVMFIYILIWVGLGSIWWKVLGMW